MIDLRLNFPELNEHQLKMLDRLLYDAGYMTGQEWYDVFFNELSDWAQSAHSADYNRIMEAARKAAKIDE